MFAVLSITVFLLLLARLLRAPASMSCLILAVVVLILAGSQLLPPGTALREEVRASAVPLFWIGIATVPIAGYVLAIRAIRRRTLPERAPVPAPTGLVLIPDDAALARDTEAAITAETGIRDQHLSVGWRDAEGTLVGHTRLRLRGPHADLDLLWVAPAARGHGIGGRLIAQAGEEARRRGARTLDATVFTPRAAACLARHGFRAYAAADDRIHLRKPLP